MKKPVAGLLPLYVELYDKSTPHMRPVVEEFYAKIAGLLCDEGIEILTCPVCRLEDEFAAAVHSFEEGGAQSIITLHLAYSPSLESAAPLAATRLPLIVLDTTPDYKFDYTIDSDRINYDHGIHGVQDMCNLLRRNRKHFDIYAGHYEKSPVLGEVAAAARAAMIAGEMRGMRVGIVGRPFKGMGDFALPESQLAADFDMKIVKYDLTDDSLLGSVTQSDIDSEYAIDSAAYRVSGIPRDVYDNTERVALAVRKWADHEGLGAFTMNFQAAGCYPAFPTMPFSEASKAMARGVGYAGEGDMLTAMLTGALLSAYPDATFAEMFCPDWEGGSVFFSHMGEYNLRAAAVPPHMIVKPFPYAPGYDPTCLMGHMRAGAACFVNLAPMGEGRYAIILTDGQMLDLPEKIGDFEDAVSGWFRPNAPLERFLAEYSRAGGTHHGALVYGATAGSLKPVAGMLGFDSVII